MSEPAAKNPYRLLPSIDELLGREAVRSAADGLPRPLVAELANALLAATRTAIGAGDLDAAAVAAWAQEGGAERDLAAAFALERGRGVRRAINVSGVVLNTGLGRAPVHPEAAEAMAAAARSFCVLEVDRFTGKRNQRDERLSVLLSRLTGAEAGIAVNNCAAAVLLTLQTWAGGRSALVSRGELVEIGGSFRMPSVMERAGVRLVEVGTTNRTRIADYEDAIDDTTGLLLKVHTSNYRVVGFTEEVGPAELDELGRRRGVRTAYDLGSGLVDPDGASSLRFLGDEPPLAEAVASGMDVAMFSGDKLLGGPQAGMIVGRREAIAELRKNPLYRALRCDKVTLAGLETTIQLLLSGRGDELPARSMLLEPGEALRPVAVALAAELGGLQGVSAEVVPERSQPGSGSAPEVYLDTFCVAVKLQGRSTERLAVDLRAGDPPVFARIHEDRLLMDVRTLLPGDFEALVAAFGQLV